VFRRYTEQGDPTRWGLVNAVTAEARTMSSALMLDLERLGGLIVGIPAVASSREYSRQSLTRGLKKVAAA
jgi:hypothetical protein